MVIFRKGSRFAPVASSDVENDADVGFDRTINLTREDFEEFERIMAEPGQPNDKLRDLLRGYTIVSQRKLP